MEVEYVGDDARLIRTASERSGQALNDAVRSLSCAAAAGQLAGPRHTLLYLIVALVGLAVGLVAPSVAHALRSLAVLRFV